MPLLRQAQDPSRFFEFCDGRKGRRIVRRLRSGRWGTHLKSETDLIHGRPSAALCFCELKS